MRAAQTAHTATRTSTRLEYLLHVPPSYDPGAATRWPLIFFLHGAGERGCGALDRVKTHGIPRIVEQRPDFPFITAAPQCGAGDHWGRIMPDLQALLQELFAEHAIDCERVYLSGISMGGYGSWRMAAERPDIFAAVVPICGGGDPSWAPRLRQVPIWAFHGAEDDIVPVTETLNMIQALHALDAPARLTVYEGVRHDSWTQTYDNPELYSWLLQHRRHS